MIALKVCLVTLAVGATVISGPESPFFRVQTTTKSSWEVRGQKISGGFVAAKRLENHNLWAVGREGDISDARTPSVIVNSTDMGFTWTRKMLIPECCLFDIFFISSRVGWAVGAGIFHTTDGGSSWIRQQSSRSGNISLKMVRFISPRKGWAVGALGEVLRTVDGGAHWEQSKLPSGWVNNEFKGWVNCFSFADEFNGWILGDHGQAYQTTDGGRSWHSRSPQLLSVLGAMSSVPDFKEVRFFTKDVGFMIVESRGVHESENEYVIRPSTVRILKTENGGRQWVLQGEVMTAPIVRAYLLSEQEWWLQSSSRRALLHTLDSGKSWMQTKLPDDANGGVLLFVDSSTIWMLSHGAGFDGSNLLTRDGGKTWVSQKSNYRTSG